MMTLKEKLKRTGSLLAHRHALLDTSSKHFRTATELMCAAWSNLPQSILRHVRNAEKSHRQLGNEAFRLWKKLSNADYMIIARPHIWESEDGKTRIVMPGRLPNHEDTSRDEDEALKMYAAYKVVADAEAAERIANMEVPF